MFKIGEFSHLVRISPRMLRHYEKCGLLFPIEIDKFTGYRWYSAGQIPLASNIVRLRDFGFSIEEIGDILPHMDNFSYMNKALLSKVESVKAVIDTEQSKLDRLLEMCNTMQKESKIMVFEVELKKLSAVKVISLRGIIPKYNEEGILWAKLGQYVGENQVPCHTDGYSTYFDEEYMEANPDVEIAIPVDTLGESDGDFVYKEYEEIPVAATVRFTGAFDGGYDAASAKLAQWMEENDYTFAGNLRGHTLVSPDDDPNPDNWETELQVPVMKK